jgi:antitoxin ParD1/3/4
VTAIGVEKTQAPQGRLPTGMAHWHTMPYSVFSQLEVQTMPTRNVVLTEHQEAFIGELVRSGRYSNASEVLCESLRLMERRESLEAAKLDYLRGRLDEAERDATAGRLVTYGPGLLDRLDREIEGESTGSDAP